MLEVLVCKDHNITQKLFKEAEVALPQTPLAIRAMNGEEMLGFCLFDIEDEKETVLFLSPEKDTLLADGLIRSALHVGTQRNITEAFYGEKVSTDLLKKINFLEDEKEKKLKLQNLFTDCCNCGK
jgi:hypothetical protein